MNKVWSVIFFLTFLNFALLQYNDPDPVFWMLVYLATALVSLLQLLNRSNRKFTITVMVVLILISFFYLPGFWEWLWRPDKEEIFGEMTHDKPYIEETREFIGLLMGIGSVYYQYHIQKSSG